VWSRPPRAFRSAYGGGQRVPDLPAAYYPLHVGYAGTQLDFAPARTC